MSTAEAPVAVEAAAADEAHDILDSSDLAAEAENEPAGQSESATESEELIDDGEERAAHSTADTAAGSQELDALEQAAPTDGV